MTLNFLPVELMLYPYGKVHSMFQIQIEDTDSPTVNNPLSAPPPLHHGGSCTLPPVFISKKSSLGILPNNNFGFLSMGRGCFSTPGGKYFESPENPHYPRRRK